jgi:hypothetical protein
VDVQPQKIEALQRVMAQYPQLLAAGEGESTPGWGIAVQQKWTRFMQLAPRAATIQIAWWQPRKRLYNSSATDRLQQVTTIYNYEELSMIRIKTCLLTACLTRLFRKAPK